MKIGFNGLGAMGFGMAKRLCEAGFDVGVYNRTLEKAKALKTFGARVCESPAKTAKDADIVLAMVADDAASAEVWKGPSGVLANTNRDAVLIECSTLSLHWVRELAAAATERGCAFIDAPVTGTKPHAEQGQLLFLAGGDGASIDRARPAFQAMGRDVVHLGPTGSGTLIKLVNNFLCGVQAVSLAEALVFIERSGLDQAAALKVLLEGAPGSPLIKTLSGRMKSKDYTTNFALELMRKDLDYAIAEGQQLGLQLQTAQSARQRFADAQNAGLGRQDFSSVIEAIAAPASE